MRTLLTLVLAAAFFCTARAENSGHVFKVLPLLLDHEGRTATSPSLFDRDAYQAQLRNHPEQVSAIRYDVEWKAKKTGAEKFLVRLELRAIATDGKPKLKTLESPVAPGGFFHKWTSLTLDADEMKKLGGVVAWRATLLDGTTVVGEQKSFLW
jgi:hypothetical protein